MIKMPKGLVRLFRTYLNNKEKDNKGNVKRGYGDYLYNKDTNKFKAMLIETITGKKPEYLDFLDMVKLNDGKTSNKLKSKTQRSRKMVKVINEERLGQYSVNLICIKCKEHYHIRVNDIKAWEKINNQNYICSVCKPAKRRKQ